jgi:hypothetical protein
MSTNLRFFFANLTFFLFLLLEFNLQKGSKNIFSARVVNSDENNKLRAKVIFYKYY